MDPEIEAILSFVRLAGAYADELAAIVVLLWVGARTYTKLRRFERNLESQQQQIKQIQQSLPPTAERSAADLCNCGHRRDGHKPAVSLYPDLIAAPEDARGACLFCGFCDEFRRAPTPALVELQE